MFLDNYINSNATFKKNRLMKESFTFSAVYDYWKEILFERTVRLFVWKNTGDVPPKEIEFALMLNGSGAVTDKYNNTLTIFNGMYSGKPTVYYDIYESYSVYSPVYSRILKTGSECIVIDNNACRNSVYPLVHRYAIMLAHLEVSFVNTLINGRDSGGIPIASTAAQKTAIENYRNSLCNGKVTSILDPAFSGVQFIGIDKNTKLGIGELVEARNNILSSFYSDIGVKTAREKRGNMITEEVNANDTMLMLNLSDMLNSRKIGVEKVNEKYGTNWSVDVAPELNYYNEEVFEDETMDN